MEINEKHEVKLVVPNEQLDLLALRELVDRCENLADESPIAITVESKQVTSHPDSIVDFIGITVEGIHYSEKPSYPFHTHDGTQCRKRGCTDLRDSALEGFNTSRESWSPNA